MAGLFRQSYTVDELQDDTEPWFLHCCQEPLRGFDLGSGGLVDKDTEEMLHTCFLTSRNKDIMNAQILQFLQDYHEEPRKQQMSQMPWRSFSRTLCSWRLQNQQSVRNLQSGEVKMSV